ncbi:MAG TPA: hypothetical protein VGL39_18470 [Jatrophihabitantaceae bacterium]|jgi:hypothetical protein
MSDPYLLTLHTLTLRQLADADQLAAIIEQDADDIKAALEKGIAVAAVAAARGSYMITPAGRDVLDAAYPAWFADQRSDQALVDAIEQFEAGVNKRVLTLMTDWQTIDVNGDRAPNHHADADYDAKIIDRLGGAHEKAHRVLQPLVDREPYVGRFLARVGAALTRAESGETDYVSGVRVDSFHTVWFQMHEHLLRVMGRERPE